MQLWKINGLGAFSIKLCIAPMIISGIYKILVISSAILSSCCWYKIYENVTTVSILALGFGIGKSNKLVCVFIYSQTERIIRTHDCLNEIISG